MVVIIVKIDLEVIILVFYKKEDKNSLPLSLILYVERRKCGSLVHVISI